MAGAAKEVELWRWNCITEETLLLHDDLPRLADHIPIPSRVMVHRDDQDDEDYGLPVMDGKSPLQLATIIHKECGACPTVLSSLMEYRFNALSCLWSALKSSEQKTNSKRKEDSDGPQSAAKSGHGSEGSFASRVSLLLLFPTLRSLSKIDPQLSQETTSILLETLRTCEPLSLSKEPVDTITGIEQLLSSWISGAKETELQTAASALVALTVAVGTGGLLLRTVHKLQSLLPSSPSLLLQMPTVLHKLLKDHVALEEPSAINSSNHLLCWNMGSVQLQNDCEDEVARRSISFDGKFVYVTSPSGSRLMKLGSGLRGTLRGFMYSSVNTDKCWVVHCQGRLLMKAQNRDTDDPFCYVLDHISLKTGAEVCYRVHVDEPHTTLHLMSDGQQLYWMYMLKAAVAHPVLGHKIKRHLVFLQALLLRMEDGVLEVVNDGDRVLLQRPVEEKNADIMKLMRGGGSYAASAAVSSLLGGNKDEIGTSMGMGLKQVQSSACYCTGSSLIMVSSAPSSSGSRSLFSSSGSPPGRVLCVSFSYSLSSGHLISQSDLSSTVDLHCSLARGASTQAMATCYDGINHCVWMTCDEWIDVWRCGSRVRPAAHLLAVRMNHTSLPAFIPPPTTSSTIPLSEVIELLLRHSGIESCRLASSRDLGSPISHNLSLAFLENCITILQCCVKECHWNNALANVITLEAVLPGYIKTHSDTQTEFSSLLSSIREIVWELVANDSCPERVLCETRRLICDNIEHLSLLAVREDEDVHKFIDLLSTPSLNDLCEELLIVIARKLRFKMSVPSSLVKMATKLAHSSITTDSLAVLRTVINCPVQELSSVTATVPVVSPALQCSSAILNRSLRKLAAFLDQSDANSDNHTEERHTYLLEEAQSALMNTCNSLSVFSACEETLKCVSSWASSLPLESEEKEEEEEEDGKGPEATPHQQRVQAIERALKSTAVGCFLPPLLAVTSRHQLNSLFLSTQLLESLSPLGHLAAEACGFLYHHHQKVSVPTPWASGRTMESIHPVRDNYKFKETVSFPGAKQLFIKMDSRCATQYDYDKVILFAGDNPSCPKVAEFGGNTHGFGSRSVLGKGWPKELVKIDGDTVTVTFEMKSGREHSTPDRALWGFSLTVRPQEMAESGSNGLPFLLDIHLSLSSVCCSLIGQLFNGAPPSKEEIECEQIMESNLLQRCMWHQEVLNTPPVSSPEHRLPDVFLQRLRNVVGQPQPTLRPSIRKLLKVDELEEVLVRLCLKYHGISAPLTILTSEGADPQNYQLIRSMFLHISGLERRLQALAELEAQWRREVSDLIAGHITVQEAFFYELLQQESSFKSFELLCCLKAVPLTVSDLFSAAQKLRGILELDVEKTRSAPPDECTYSQTSNLVAGILERAQLLLHVSVSPPDPPEATPTSISRSVSSPAAVIEGGKSYWRQKSAGTSSSSSLTVLVDVPSDVAHQTLLDQIFLFIGSKPEQAVSCEVFLTAARQQKERGFNRLKALSHIQALLSSKSCQGLALEHMLAGVVGVMVTGPQASGIRCSGLEAKVRESFASAMLAVVQMASCQPVACINTIALLCTVPYTREDETCLVRSGLVKLLNKMCSLTDESAIGEEEEEEEDAEALQRATTLAWAAFQVLADRCVSWETKGMGVVSSGLAKQVSLLLTNHLSRAMKSLALSDSGASDTLQEALSMLLGLAKSHMGRAILSQPACISKLLLLLTDHRPSPRLILIVLQLCRVSLPLMMAVDCSKVVIPPHPTLSSPAQTTAATIVQLLMAKLAEYIVPVSNEMPMKLTPTKETTPTHTTPKQYPLSPDDVEETGQASVVIYRRDNESAADILQMLLNHDPRQLGQRMEAILRLDQSLSDEGKAEVLTESYRSCHRRALRWASMGFTVSIESPAHKEHSSVVEKDRKFAKAESACRKRNLDLLKSDPPRPFLSGVVAYSLASEIIALLKSLLMEEEAVQVWKDAIRETLDSSLSSMPVIVPQLVSYCADVHSCVASGETPPSPGALLSSSCMANATFAALGGFKDTLRPGQLVKVTGSGIIGDCQGTIVSISEQRGMANVQFHDELCFGPNRMLEVSLARLQPPVVGSLPLDQLELEDKFCSACREVLATSPLVLSSSHSSIDASLSALGLCRLFAELRTRVTLSLAHHSEHQSLREQLLNSCSTDQLLQQVECCDPGQRLSLMEAHCLNLRMLYRDSSRPVLPSIDKPSIEPKKYYWNVTREWPPVHSCYLSHSLLAVTYQGPSTSSSGTDGGSSANPKGVFLLTNDFIPVKAPSFYWELEVCQLEAGSAASITLGYCPALAPLAEEQEWAYPEETCLIRSTGRGCRVRGTDRMQWDKISMDSGLVNGDVIGCGWFSDKEGSLVFFTKNGQRHPTQFRNTPVGMYPFVHLQKKGTRIKANFGQRPFMYSDGHAYRQAADIVEGESDEDRLAIFLLLPFAYVDTDPEIVMSEQRSVVEDKKKNEEEISTPNAIPIHKLQSSSVDTYPSSSAILHSTEPSFSNMLESGPFLRPRGGHDPGEDVEESSSLQEEDLHVLLVKAWETKVFPIIQRRFRNDQERKSGLEQIRGALQLGMDSIAQETVEFLYEENGGLPRDLHLPTMDDVKADLDKFTISKVKKGSLVMIRRELPYARIGVRAMQKTQGLPGVVLMVDESTSLVQVECYLPNEGALVRFWFPVFYLERPPKGFRKPAALRGVESTHISVHRELLSCEATLTAMYCRKALLALRPPLPSSSPQNWLSNFNLLVNDSFAQPTAEGHVFDNSPLMASSTQSCLQHVLPSPHSLFFNDCSRVESEVVIGLLNCKADLTRLASLVCAPLTASPSPVGSTNFSISESKDHVQVTSTASAFLVVSSPEEKLKSSSGASYKYPWGKVLCSRGGGQSKGGRMILQEVAIYPSQFLQTTTHHYCGPILPTVILPTGSCHLKFGGCSPPPGRQLSVTGVPSVLPATLLFIDVLCIITAKHGGTPGSGTEKGKSSNSILEGLTKALVTCLKSLTQLLTHTDLPPVLREKVLHCVSGVCWTLHYFQHATVVLPAVFMSGIHTELAKVYEHECAGFPANDKPKSSSLPSPGSLANGGSGRFSTYFQSLLEAVLATDLVCSSDQRSTPSPVPSHDAKRRRSKPSSGNKKKDWLVYIKEATSLLLQLHRNLPPPTGFYNCFLKSLPVRPQYRLLVVSGLNPSSSDETMSKCLSLLCSKHGGLYSSPYLTMRGNEVDSENYARGAVLELSSAEKSKAIKDAILSSTALQSNKKLVTVSTISDNLHCGEETIAKHFLMEYLKHKLLTKKASTHSLASKTHEVFTTLWSSAGGGGGLLSRECVEGEGENLLHLFLIGTCNGNGYQELLEKIWLKKKKIGKERFLSWALQQCKNNPCSVWLGLMAVGYDLQFVKCGFTPTEARQCSLSRKLDYALVQHVDVQCRKFAITSSALQPWEVTISESDLVSEELSPLQGVSLADLRLRFLQLKHINRQLSRLLPLVDLRSLHPLSLSSLLRNAAPLLFYDVKISFLHSVLNAATRRSLDQPPPEIKMDPLESISGLPSSAVSTHFCQAASQLLTVPSPQLCVPLASGGDPTYAFNVKMTGEEVHGTSGSFRHFLWQVVRELQSPLLPLLSLCPSSAIGTNKGKYIFTTGPMTYTEEKLLEFFGQLVGVAIRADVPMAMDLLPCFWKNLKEEPLVVADLREADIITYNFTQQLLEVKDEAEFEELVSGLTQSIGKEEECDHRLMFSHKTLAGHVVELCENGSKTPVRFEDRQKYATAVRQRRLRELSCEERVAAMRCGLSSVVPLQLLSLLTPQDLKLRVCGLSEINLNYLRSHTTYHVGLMATDQHIQFFWTALESFTQEELTKFIKFACNQERIPFGFSCRQDHETHPHVPPYPMKIAPPDGADNPDSRYIRAETCMFLVKLPQYSSQEIMTEKLRYAINCREDPLSG